MKLMKGMKECLFFNSLIFFNSCLTSECNRMVMTDLKECLVKKEGRMTMYKSARATAVGVSAPRTSFIQSIDFISVAGIAVHYGAAKAGR